MLFIWSWPFRGGSLDRIVSQTKSNTCTLSAATTNVKPGSTATRLLSRRKVLGCVHSEMSNSPALYKCRYLQTHWWVFTWTTNPKWYRNSSHQDRATTSSSVFQAHFDEIPLPRTIVFTPLSTCFPYGRVLFSSFSNHCQGLVTNEAIAMHGGLHGAASETCASDVKNMVPILQRPVLSICFLVLHITHSELYNWLDDPIFSPGTWHHLAARRGQP